MKRKPLKIWQGILIAIGSVLLAVGGVVLYVFFTSGIGTKIIYPEDVSFITDDTKNYNIDRGQFETSDNFFLSLNSATENVSEKKLKLSFTKNFTDAVDENGFITDGVITIPQMVEMGTPFEVIVNKKGGVNVGGISNLYAMTENKVILPTSTKIAIDVPVENITLEFVDKENPEVKAELKNERFNLTEGTEVKINTLFTPERSAYIYSDEQNKKSVFYEVVDGVEDFVLDSTNGTISVSNRLKKTGKIKAYTFINAEDQIAFYEANKDKTDSQIYVDAIQYLSGHKDKAKIVEANLIIVEAVISSFSVGKESFTELKIDNEYTLTAGASDEVSTSLGINIFDSLNQSIPSMIKSVAARVLEKKGDKFEPVGQTTIYENGVAVNVPKAAITEGKEVNLAKATDDRKFVFIDSSPLNVRDANFDVYANVPGEYYLEIVLMLRYIEESGELSDAETYYVFNDDEESIKIKLEFNEINEGGVDWKNNEGIEMVVYPGTDAPKSQYENNLETLTNVAESGNFYKTQKFFADFGDEFFARYSTDEEALAEIRNYFDVDALQVYEIGGLVRKLALLSSKELLVSKGGEFSLYFATIQTYANGKLKYNQDGTFVVSKWSNALNVNAIETIVLSEENLSVTFEDSQIYEDGGDKFIISAVGETEFTLTIDLDKENADRVEKQKSNFSFVAYEEEGEYENCLTVESFERIVSSNKYEIKLKFNANMLSGGVDRKMKIAVIYSTVLGTEAFTANLSNVDVLTEDTITVYRSEADSIDLGNISSYDGKEIRSYKISVNIEGGEVKEAQIAAIDEDGFTVDNGITSATDFNDNLESIKIYDKYGKDITESSAPILSTSNSNIISIEDNKIVIGQVSSTEDIGECVVAVTAGKKVERISFSPNPATISKIEKLASPKVDADVRDVGAGEKIIQEENLSSVSVSKLGFGNYAGADGNSITLANLLKIYIGADALNSDEYYFTLSSVQALEEVDYLFGTQQENISGEYEAKIAGMINLKGLDSDGNEIDVYSKKINVDGEIIETITSSTIITQLNIAYDFYRNVSLTFNVIGKNLGLNLALTLEIGSNISVDVTNFRGIDYGDKQKPEDFGDYVGTYAEFEINLKNQSYFKVIREGTGEPAAITSFEGKSNEQYRIADGKLVFGDVYTPENKIATISTSSEVAGNPYAFNYDLKFKIYPNFEVSTDDHINLTEIVPDGGKDVSSTFTISRYVGNAELPTGLVSKIADSNFAIQIDDDKFVLEKTKTALFDNIQQEKEFTIIVLKDNLAVCDYTGQEIQKSIKLVLGFDLNTINKENSWFKVTTYNAKDTAIIEYKNETDRYEVNPFVDDDLSNYSLVPLNTNPLRFQIEETIKLKLKSINTDRGIVYNEYLDFALYFGGQDVAHFKIPVIISYVGTDFAYYAYYKSHPEDFDIKDVLNEDKDQIEVYAESFMAGKEKQLLYTTTGSVEKEGIYYNASAASCEIEIVEGNELATVDAGNISIKNLAKEDQNIIVRVTLTSNYKTGKSYTYYYGIQVAYNRETSINYKGGADMEYVYIGENEAFTADLSNESRFVITDKDGVMIEDPESTNKVTRVEYTDTQGQTHSYSLNAGINEFTESGKAVYTVAELVRVEFSGDNDDNIKIELLDPEKSDKIKVTVTKSYKDVIGGDLDYTFGINMTSAIYSMQYKEGDTELDGSTWTIDPKVTNELTVKTFQSDKTNPTQKSEVETSLVKTVANFSFDGNGDYVGENKDEFTIKEADGTEIAVIAFDYISKTLTVTRKAATITEAHEVNIIFSTEVYEGDTVVSGQSNVGKLTIVFNKTFKVVEKDGNLNGGGVYGFNDLIEEVKLYDGSSYITATEGEDFTVVNVQFNEEFISKEILLDSSTEGIVIDRWEDNKVKLKYIAEGKEFYLIVDDLTKLGVVTLTEATNFKATFEANYETPLKVDAIDGNNVTVSYTDEHENNYTAIISKDKLDIVGDIVLDSEVHLKEAEEAELSCTQSLATGAVITAVSDEFITLTYTDDNEIEWTVDVNSAEKIKSIKIAREESFLSVENFIVAELNENKTATFTVIIKDSSGKEYSFEITKTFTASLSAESEISYSGTYYAGEDSTPITFLNKSELVAGSSLKIDGANDEGELTKTINGIDVTLSLEGNALKIKTGNVATQTNINIPVKVNYSFNGFGYSFEFVVNITVNPNVILTTNYPKIDGVEISDETYGSYETIQTGKTVNLFNASPLAGKNRVVIKNAKTAEIIENYENAQISVKSASSVTVAEGSNKGDVKLILDSAVSTGWVVLNVKYNSVVTTYTFFVVREAVYTTENRYSINRVVEGGESVDTIYADQNNGELFNKDTLVEVQIKSSTQVSDFLDKTIYMVFEKDEDDKTVSFKLNSTHCGGKIYVDAGQSLTGYTFKEAYIIADSEHISASEIFKVDTSFNMIKPTTTQRIGLFYRTAQGNKEVEVTRFGGSRTGDVTFESNIIAGKASNTTYTAIFAIKIGDETVVESVAYKFTLDLDIAVENAFMAGGEIVSGSPMIEIDAYYSDSDGETRDLVNLAKIYKPSTGESLSQNTIGESSSTLVVYDGAPSGAAYTAWQAFVEGKSFEADAEATRVKIKGNSDIKFLIYTEVKNGDNKVYNYNLVGQGAANNGSYVMLVYTYTKDSVSKTFYIMVKVKPVYDVLIDGRSITTADSSNSSNNANDSDHIKVTANSNGDAYILTLINETGTASADPGRVQIRKKLGNNTANQAKDWTFTLTAQGTTGDYNTDLTNTNFNFSGTDGWTRTPASGDLQKYEWKKVSDSPLLKITKSSANSFGTKRYIIVATNEYGYHAEIYFDFLPVNDEEPQIDETSSFSAIEEEKTFDIGAVYQILQLEESGYVLLNSSGERKFYLTADRKTLSDIIDGQKQNPVTIETGITVDDTLLGKKVDVSKEPNNFTITLNSEGGAYTLKKNYTLTEAGEGRPAPTVINIAGISAWGFVSKDGRKEAIKDVQNNQIEGLPLTSDFANPTKMNLGKVVVNSIEFVYNGQSVGTISKAKTTEAIPSVGTPQIEANKVVTVSNFNATVKTVTISDGTNTVDNVNISKLTFYNLATAENLLIQGTSVEGDNITINGLEEQAGTYRVKGNTFTMPRLESWIYTDAASQRENLQDSVDVEMRITLRYGSGTDEEYYTVSRNITVTRKLSVDKTRQAVVGDGEEFTISSEESINLPYFRINESNDITVIDDTLVVSLPWKSGSGRPKVKVTAEVYNNSNPSTIVAKLPEQTIENTYSHDWTFNLYLSKYLKEYNASEDKFTGKGYILKAGDKIQFHFSGFENNGIFKETDLDGLKFYAQFRYGSGVLTATSATAATTDKVSIFAITKDKINIANTEGYFAEGFDQGSKTRSVVKSYTIADGGQSYRVEKEYLVTPSIYEADFPVNAESVDYYGESVDGKYTIPFANWAGLVTVYGAKGTVTTDVSRDDSGKALNAEEVDLNQFKFVIGANQSGTATIDNGDITTRAGHVPGSNEYIHIYIYVKASGIDGDFSETDSTYDYLLGSMMILVKAKTE